jgi:hypothetical protein
MYSDAKFIHFTSWDHTIYGKLLKTMVGIFSRELMGDIKNPMTAILLE